MNAAASVISSTLSTNSSFERRRATTRSQRRIGRGPPTITSTSAAVALASAAAMARPIASAGCPSTGISTSSGTTARSWNSSTAITSRPCALSSSPRSTSSFDTIAVDDMARMPPSASPACHDAPNSVALPMASASVAATCAPPRPNTRRRMVFSLVRLNSRPIENIRKTTPSSARRLVSSRSATTPSACGPSARPVTR